MDRRGRSCRSGPDELLRELSSGEFRDTSAVVRYVGTPTMNAIGQHLASDLNVSYRTRVARVEKSTRDEVRHLSV